MTKVHRSFRRRWHHKLRTLIEWAEAQGCECRGGRHFGLFWEGRRIFTMPMTPGDSKGGLNAASDLRRALRKEFGETSV